MKTIKRWLLIFCFLLTGFLLLFLVACKPGMTETNGTPTATITPPTSSKTPVPSKTPTPIATPEISLTLIKTFGKGILSEIVRSPDGKSIVTCDGHTIRWLNAEDYSERGSINIADKDSYPSGCDIVFSPDSRLIVFEDIVGQSVIDLETQKILEHFSGGNGPASSPVFFPDNQSVVYLGKDRTTGGPYEFIGFVNVIKGEVKDIYHVLYEGRYHTLSDPAVNPDGSLVAAGYSDRTNNILYIWDAVTGETRFEIKEQPSRITSVVFSPDGKTLASAGDDGIVRFWNPASGQIRQTVTGFPDSLNKVSFSSDGRQLIVTVRNQSTMLYNLATGKIMQQEKTISDPLVIKMLQEGYLLPGGTSKVLFSPDGKNIAVAQGSIQIWNIESGKLIATLYEDNSLSISTITFSTDGNQLAAITNSGEVYAWNIPSQQLVLHLTTDTLQTSLNNFYTARGSSVNFGNNESTYWEKGIAFSSNGKQIAVCNNTIIEIWDIQTARKVMTLEHVEDAGIPTAVSYSEDGKHIFAIMNRNEIAMVWDIATGKLMKSLDLPVVNPDASSGTALYNSLLARNNCDKDNCWIELWNLEAGEMIDLSTSSGFASLLRFNADGSLLIAANDYRVYVWRTDTGKLALVTDSSFHEVTDHAISLDGKILASVNFLNGEASLWDISDYMQAALQPDFTPPALPPTSTPYSHDYPTSTTTPTPESTLIPILTSQAGAIVPENVDQVSQLAQFGKGTISGINWSSINDAIIVSSSQGSYQFSPGTLTERNHFDTQSIWVTSSQLLPDGRWLVAGFTNDDKTQVWDANQKRMLVELNGSGQPAISPDGKWVVYGVTKGLATWDLETGQQGPLLLSTRYSSSWPVFSPDSKLVAAIQSDSSVRVWNIATGTIVNAVGGPEADITDMSFSQDGNYIVGAAGGSAWVWSIVPGQAPFELSFDEGTIDGNLTLFDTTVTAVAMSPDSILIAIGTSEHKIWFYNRNTKQLQGTISNLSGIPNKMVFSPDSTQLASIDRDGRMVIWDVETQNALVSSHVFGYPALGLVNRLDGNVSVWAENTTWVIDPNNASLKQTTYIPSGKILAVSPVGDLVAAYSPLRVSLYNAETGGLVKTLPEEAEDVFVDYHWEGQILRQFYGSAFSSDGKYLATLGTGGIWIYKMPNGELVSHIWGIDSQKAVFSPDDLWLIAAIFEQANNPSLIRVKDGQLISYFDIIGSASPQYTFSADGTVIGLIQNNWREPSEILIANHAGQIIKRMALGDIQLNTLAFSSDNTLIAVGFKDGSIALIDSQKMEIIATLDAHKVAVSNLIFSANGHTLISTGTDGVVKVWGLP